MGTAARQNLAALLGRHAFAKAVTALANETARLIGALHDMISGKDRELARKSRASTGWKRGCQPERLG
jgi:hypothetical protein